jgi:hypothetical protein
LSAEPDPLDIPSLEARLEALTAALVHERAAIRDLEGGAADGGAMPGRSAKTFKRVALGLLLGLGAGFVLKTVFYLFTLGFNVD